MKYQLIPAFISIVLFILLLIYSDFFQVISILLKANPFYLILGFSFWFFGLLIRTERWKYLLKKAGIKVSYFKTAKVYVSGLFLSNISPGKLGDPLRSVILKATERKSVGSSLPSLFLERISDAIITLIISVVGILYFALTKLSFLLFLVVIVYSVAFSLVFYVLTSEERTRKFLKKMSSFFSFIKKVKELESKVEEFSFNLHQAFVKYKDRRILALTFFLTFIVWSIEGLILFTSFKALGLSVDFSVTIFAVCVSTLVGILTFLPGGLGSSEAVIIFIFTSLFSLTPAQVMAAAILQRIFGFWTYALLGVVLLGTNKYRKMSIS